MKFFSALLLALTSVILTAATVEIVPTEFRNFKVNEEVTFKVTAYESKNKLLNSGTFQIKVRDCNSILIKTVDVDLSKNNPLTFSAKLNRPGYILVNPSDLKDAQGKVAKWKNNRNNPAQGGAMVEPEKIRQSGKVPEDFAQFWQAGLKAYEKAQVITEPAADIKRDGYKVFRITVKHPDNSGAITGFLSIPEKPGKYPAIAGVPGAGPGTVSPNNYICCTKPAIALYMNVHPFPTAKTAAGQQKLYAELNKACKSKAYFRENAHDREKYVYRKVWLALSRAIDYVAKLPEFDGKNFAAAGNSQGGGTALAMAYLNKNITCAAASVPALCDHQSLSDKRQPGWPQLYTAYPKAPRRVAAAPYFDCATFAAGIKVPTMITVGYVDVTCSPSSVYAAYNNLKGEKTIYPMYRNGHRISPESHKALSAFLDKQLCK